MFIATGRTKRRTPLGVRCLSASKTKVPDLVISRHGTPDGVREILFYSAL
jgi:hypothetical protein